MQFIKLFISGRIPSKKNNKRITKNKKIISSADYLRWQSEKLKELEGVSPISWKRISVECHFYFPDRRRRDLTNAAESIFDLLVDAEIIADDCWKVLNDIRLVSCGVSRENPGVLLIFKEATFDLDNKKPPHLEAA